QEVASHGRSHVAQADECDFHVASCLDARSRIPATPPREEPPPHPGTIDASAGKRDTRGLTSWPGPRCCEWAAPGPCPARRRLAPDPENHLCCDVASRRFCFSPSSRRCSYCRPSTF